MMKNRKINQYIVAVFAVVAVASCKAPDLARTDVNKNVPASYNDSQDTTNSADINWREYFTDPYLTDLIDTALKYNQELNITLQEIEVSRTEIRAKKGEYLPTIGLGAGAGIEKPGRYTAIGALEENTEIKPGMEMPDPLPDFQFGLYANWELDVWKKLRNAKKAAVMRYLSSVEGKNFMVTNLVAEIADSYYELLALDNQLDLVKRNVKIQSDALEIVKLQKKNAQVTELAVRRFEAQVLNTKALQFKIQQEIVETENSLNFLLGRFPQQINRSSDKFVDIEPNFVYQGIPAQLLENRPDVRQAELELEAAKLDVKSAKAAFYPSIGITAGVGYQAFDPQYLLRTPESLLYNVAGDLMAPLVNRSAIKAQYYGANYKQVQAIYNYEQTLLNAYIEVANQVSKIDNLKQSYDLKSQQVETLTKSIEISNGLFRSARADYMEVLLTQRDALESKFELIETKQQQMNAMVNVYRALGGGWR